MIWWPGVLCLGMFCISEYSALHFKHPVLTFYNTLLYLLFIWNHTHYWVDGLFFLKIFTLFSLCCYLLSSNKQSTKSVSLFVFRVCCPEPEGPAQDPPAGELPCSRMWSLQESQSQTAAGDSRPLWSTLTPSHPTPFSSSLPHSRETTGREHTGMSKFSDWHSFIRNVVVRVWCI